MRILRLTIDMLDGQRHCFDAVADHGRPWFCPTCFLQYVLEQAPDDVAHGQVVRLTIEVKGSEP